VVTDGSIVSSDGVSIAYRDFGGDGPGLVLLHGIGGNLESMDGLARLLSADRRVVSLDIRFCGQSGDAERFRFQDAVRDIEEVTVALGLRRPAVVGASLGGIVAGHYGMRHPEQPVVRLTGSRSGRWSMRQRKTPTSSMPGWLRPRQDSKPSLRSQRRETGAGWKARWRRGCSFWTS
jgi:pimeloyl-ACP methyl ester carboxylesterase